MVILAVNTSLTLPKNVHSANYTHATLFPVAAKLCFRPLSYLSRSTLRTLHFGFGKYFLKTDDGADPFELLLLLWPIRKNTIFHLLVFPNPTWKYLVLFGPLSHPPPSLNC